MSQAAFSSRHEFGPDSDDEPQLLTRLRAQEPAAFEQLVRRHGGWMLAVARRMLGSEDDARDAVQDALISAYRAMSGFQEQSRLSTWLHRIVVNAALMKLRKRDRRQERSIEELLPRFLDDGHPADPAVEWPISADELAQQRDTREMVRRCIAQLPENYRTVLMLRDIEELDTRETARLLGIEENAVKVRLHRARAALRKLLDEHFRGDAN
ncbi:MAG: sigma-70 family RNA polymerase sigma factor [Phycisphaerae bacterium]|nr:sigma-70 family RNA polymerase sigma factor [Phycisphaerae bacterium]NUQ48170.1 sigma-70 family RNA polymerase sigma factor [Phycisphaerae bacterium]